MTINQTQSGSEKRWKWTAGLLSGVILFPLLALAWIAMSPVGDIWGHLLSTVLPGSFATTILLMAGVGIITIAIGVLTAWLVTMCDFPGRRYLDWALLIPLAVPTYIVAFAYVEVFDYTGPLQSLIRWLFGFQSARDYWFPEIRSLGGAIFVMSMVLYPYVYLTTRASFLIQSASLLDVSRTLGATPVSLFFRVALPLSRPAIAIGASLALMECLNDIGAVTFFGVRTLTFSVYDIWLNRSSLAAASQLSLAMLLMVFALLWLERQGRKRQKFHSTAAAKHKTPLRFELSTGWGITALVACLVPIVLGFVVPALLLADQASRRLEDIFSETFVTTVKNTLALASVASVVTVAVSVILAYALRLRPGNKLRSAVRFASVGYAVPGTVLAIGILIPLATLDNFISSQTKAWLGFGTGLLLSGSGVGIIYAYVIRFLAVSYGQIESGLGKISPHLDMAARTLGRTETKTLLQIHLPILKPVLLSALLLTFVDCMKELPATILLRPFNFETLATTVFSAASREAFGEAALPSLAIVLVGLLPVIFLARTSASTFRTKTSSRKGPTAAAVSA